MSASKRNAYLDHGPSDESDNDAGYDSEAAEVSKASRARASKRRKLDVDHTDDEADDVDVGPATVAEVQHEVPSSPSSQRAHEEPDTKSTKRSPSPPTSQLPKTKQKLTKKPKEKTPGVIYLSSLPPYLKPSALRNLLEQRGFSPISRLFLAPASKHKSSSKKNSRQLYTEGWIEFASKKTARNCAESLNTQLIGGRKGGFYHDDVWNMKYLRGMAWEELMAGIREEKREEEGRRDEERRIIARDTKMFIEGVEQGRVQEGMRRKRAAKGQRPKRADDGDGDGADPHPNVDVKRTWRQNEVKGQSNKTRQETMSDDVRQVLGKIF
ncbi:RNA-binding ATPase activator esf2 [Elasticomyces elasticus]|uniref:Pre-rRNA-processing protein ESF2 n=1 Tax=Exophiala sideris TaxID=1016849 RepID=A0ABR0JJY9_9EURO|nr:RNA-binding ATPase activator esf2 [Elasticomyces elasticus]KAK5034173.1 RNA-binding ATPase activator esf2 [Exophiala sideris]KAK5042469.1 RNA-binding ATPase activator esf2 [Exophiala sideris]KAK5065551.1 RNA-binding ATPase activator esf2 [Exophiala sideris]KAK5185991.1 RNA-binding ATPase activator esf2 [Eurotiomycetes sp. CCFEE 6388]